MLKNPKPYQLAVFAGLIIAISTFGLLLLLKLLHLLELEWIFVLLMPITLYIISYYVVAAVLKRYIYRRVKVIYKMIRQAKMNPLEKKLANKVDLNDDILDQVQQEVSDWEISRNDEILELKKLAEYRRDFMGDISHELKTPIFNIQGYLHTLLDGGLEDEAINLPYLGKAAKNVERLHSIVQDLETISTMESGFSQLDITEFNIYELIELVFEEQYIKAKQKGIELNFKRGADEKFIVKGDKEKISQVLVNLVSNSIKYGKQGGRTQASFYEMDGVVLVEIADDGIGIEQEHLNRLFDRFFRVDKSRSRKAGGTGLGLAIVKHIIEAHQQTVNVRSAVGQGTTFGFTLDKA